MLNAKAIMTKYHTSRSITSRRLFLGAGVSLLSIPTYRASAFPLSPLIGIFARSLFVNGARSVPSAVLKRSIQVGVRRSGRKLPRNFSRLSRQQQVTLGTALRISKSPPVWRARSTHNALKVDVRANLSNDVTVPISISIYDIDDGALEDGASYDLELPYGEFNHEFTIDGKFSEVEIGRKEVAARHHAQSSLDISISTEPLIIVVD